MKRVCSTYQSSCSSAMQKNVFVSTRIWLKQRNGGFIEGLTKLFFVLFRLINFMFRVSKKLYALDKYCFCSSKIPETQLGPSRCDKLVDCQFEHLSQGSFAPCGWEARGVECMESGVEYMESAVQCSAVQCTYDPGRTASLLHYTTPLHYTQSL